MCPYEKLTNVRIMQVTYQRSIWEAPDSPDMWMAIYHKIHEQWIVTNDIEYFGLNDLPENLDIVGYGTDINSVMFAVWEHQKSLGLSHTLMDDIRQNKRVRPSEWGWGKPLNHEAMEIQKSQLEVNRSMYGQAEMEKIIPFEKPRKKWKFW